MTQETTDTPRTDAVLSTDDGTERFNDTILALARTLERERDALERSIRSAIASIEAGNHHLALTTLEAALKPTR